MWHLSPAVHTPPQSGAGGDDTQTRPKSVGDARDAWSKREDNDLQQPMKPQPMKPQPMKSKNLLVRFAALFVLASAPAIPAHAADGTSSSSLSIDAVAAETGSITGVVSNRETGAYLEGAGVVLQPGNYATTTGRGGIFRISRVPPGQYTLEVSYAGLDSRNIPVKIGGDELKLEEVGLTSVIYTLDKFVVSGEREGNAAAIARQKAADSVKVIMASDAFGNVADQNIANFIMRMPGITKRDSEGDAEGVLIRGISPDLSLITVDGALAANASVGGMTRGYELDKMSADIVESIEVQKSLTPDMDAGAIGGIVNMKTKSALDRKGRRIGVQLGQSYNTWRRTFRPNASVSYSDIIGPRQNLGIMLSGSYNRTSQPRDNSNMAYEQTLDTNRPIWFNSGPWGEDLFERRRSGLNARLDYRLPSGAKLYARASSSEHKLTLDRHRGQLSNPAAANILTVTDTVTEARNQTFTYVQLHDQRSIRSYNYLVGGEIPFKGAVLDFQASYSPSKGTSRQVNAPRAVNAGQFRQERTTSRKYVTVTQTGGSDIFDFNNQLLTNLVFPDTFVSDRISGGQINLTKAFETRLPVTLKAGLKTVSAKKTQDNEQSNYAYVGANGVAGPRGAANDDNLSQFLDESYNHKAFDYFTDQMKFLDLVKVQNALRTTPQHFQHNIATSVQNSLANDRVLTEDIDAAYFMGTLRWQRLTAVGGVRFEKTRTTGRANRNEITAAEAARRAAWVGPLTDSEIERRTVAQYGNPIRASGGYEDYFPSINLKYQATPRLVARLAYSTSIGRPPVSQLVPVTTVNTENETITANNPNLGPQRSKNYDASVEYYFKSAGTISIGLFRKDMTGFRYRTTAAEALGPGNPFGDEYIGYDLNTLFNGGKGFIQGVEVTYQHHFGATSLPEFLRRFGVYANFTWLETRGNFNDPAGGVQTSELAEFTPRSGNIGLTYVARGLTLRAQAKYECAHLHVFNANPVLKEYMYATFPVDFNVEYAFSRNWRVFADMINAFNNATQDRYLYVPERPSRTFRFSSYVKAGVMRRF